ncbi:hypothetical protein [Macrococcus bovicus]|uniref:Uncharacterized protein n=1 Tax=Macrococcus bovicus TaxID=69968 RepID=A0A4R6BV18_9STAP|nr:hypothetical protein [Macrococcus bovicus]TDM12166.1 hypothetical protein ERX55_11175 [Macrococcus bovicus]
MRGKEDSIIKKILFVLFGLLGLNFILKTFLDFDYFDLDIVADTIMFLIALTILIGSILEKHIGKILGAVVFLFLVVVLIIFA